MGYKIQDIEGIGPVFAEKLGAAGITNTNQLLKQCCEKKGRSKVSGQCGLTESQLLKWANMADLMRISGVGSEYSELLEAAGVDTVKELKHRRADSLMAKMKEVNQTRKLVRQAPSQKNVERWIEQAKTMEPLITH